MNLRNSRTLIMVAFASAYVVLCLHTIRFLPFLSDDALISLRYAKRLIAGRGLNWNDGEWVEGYSNLLWILCSSVLGFLGIDLVLAVRILGYVCMGAVFAAILFVHRSNLPRSFAIALLPLLFLASAAPFAVWTVGGMEQPMVAALLAWAAVLMYPLVENGESNVRSVVLPGLLLALLCWARLDGPVFVAAAVIALLLTKKLDRQSVIQAAGLAILPLAFCLIQVGFRFFYYGEWIPNTALVKFTPSGRHALDGWGYLRAGAYPIFPLVALAALSIAISFLKRFKRERMILLTTLALSWAAYVVVIGGDIFPAWRHFIPLLVLLSLMISIGAEWVHEHASTRAYGTAICAGVLSLLLFAALQFRDAENFRAISERWEWEGEVIGTLLKRAFQGEQPLVAVDPAGCLPYWSELPSVDMLGLNDYYLPRHPPANLGEGAIGHELGDGKYVLDRKPDLVIFLLPTGSEHAYFRGGKEMQADPRFVRDYTLVRFEGREPFTVQSLIWVRRFSERIGIKQTENGLSIPGFLLNGNRETIARLGDDGRLVATVSRNAPATLKDIQLSPGRWRVDVDGSGSFQIKIAGPEGRALAHGESGLEFDTVTGSVELEIASSNSAEISEVRFMRGH